MTRRTAGGPGRQTSLRCRGPTRPGPTRADLNKTATGHANLGAKSALRHKDKHTRPSPEGNGSPPAARRLPPPPRLLKPLCADFHYYPRGQLLFWGLYTGFRGFQEF